MKVLLAVCPALDLPILLELKSFAPCPILKPLSLALARPDCPEVKLLAAILLP
jgi:hypothetical protein